MSQPLDFQDSCFSHGGEKDPAFLFRRTLQSAKEIRPAGAYVGFIIIVDFGVLRGTPARLPSKNGPTVDLMSSVRGGGLAFQVHGFPTPAVNLPGRPDR